VLECKISQLKKLTPTVSCLCYVDNFGHVLHCSYLHVSGDTYGRPISGQREVSGYSSLSDHNQWKAAEGIFLKPTDAGLESRGMHDEL